MTCTWCKSKNRVFRCATNSIAPPPQKKKSSKQNSWVIWLHNYWYNLLLKDFVIYHRYVWKFPKARGGANLKMLNNFLMFELTNLPKIRGGGGEGMTQVSFFLKDLFQKPFSKKRGWGNLNQNMFKKSGSRETTTLSTCVDNSIVSKN